MKVQLIVEFEALDEGDAFRIEEAIRVLSQSVPGIAITVRRNARVR